MRHKLIAAMALLLAGAAAAQSPQDAARPVHVWKDDDSGGVVVSTRGWKPVKRTTGYSVAAEQQLVIWVEAAKLANGAKRLMLVGEKARYIEPRESQGSKTYGPSDPPEPAYVGSPFTEADLRYRNIKVECSDDVHWCAEIWSIEIIVPDATLDAYLRNLKAKALDVALDKRRKVDWSVPREEIEAALLALDKPPAEPAE